MSVSSISPVQEDGSMSSRGPSAGGPTLRRSFPRAQKTEDLSESAEQQPWYKKP